MLRRVINSCGSTGGCNVSSQAKPAPCALQPTKTREPVSRGRVAGQGGREGTAASDREGTGGSPALPLGPAEAESVSLPSPRGCPAPPCPSPWAPARHQKASTDAERALAAVRGCPPTGKGQGKSGGEGEHPSLSPGQKKGESGPSSQSPPCHSSAPRGHAAGEGLCLLDAGQEQNVAGGDGTGPTPARHESGQRGRAQGVRALPAAPGHGCLARTYCPSPGTGVTGAGGSRARGAGSGEGCGDPLAAGSG